MATTADETTPAAETLDHLTHEQRTRQMIATERASQRATQRAAWEAERDRRREHARIVGLAARAAARAVDTTYKRRPHCTRCGGWIYLECVTTTDGYGETVCITCGARVYTEVKHLLRMMRGTSTTLPRTDTSL